MSKRNPRNLLLLEQIKGNPFAKTVAPRAFDILSDFEKDMEAVSLNRKLSAEGRQEEAQKYLRRAIRDLRDIQKPLDEYRAKTEEMRASIKLATYDKTDVVAAMARREIRDASRAMTFGQRAAKLSGPTRSVAYIDAVLEFEDDPWLSGIDVFNVNEVQVFEEAKLERLRDLHGPLLDQVAERENTEREVRDLILAVARVDIQAASGLESKVFEAIARPIETRAGAPWILPDRKTVCEVLPNGQAAYHPASEDELRDGRQFPDLAAYLASRAAA